MPKQTPERARSVDRGRRRGVHRVGDAPVTVRDEIPQVAHRVVSADERTFTSFMEQLQEGYVASVAATAGCNMERIPKDNYGFDVRIVRPAPPGEEEVTLNVQLKSTTTIKPDPAKPHFSHKLKKREYLQRLVTIRKHNKAILLVMATSPIQSAWTSADHDFLKLQHCCYWACLEGDPVDEGVGSPTVHIPTKNIFNGAALAILMDKLDRGEPIR